VIHNFPARGIMAVNLRIDRDGNVQEVGSIVTTNVALQDSALEQIRSWKFKPYLQDGNAVQVNTYLAIPYEAKVELLGTNKEVLPAESFFSRIEKSQKLSDPRTEGAAPFHLKASFEAREGLTGLYEETWLSPTRWRRQVQLGTVNVVRSLSGDNLYEKSVGADSTPKLINFVFDNITSHFPRTDGSFIEGDWGQSAVSFDGLDTVRISRGAVDEENQPISGGAYWFDSAGLLRGAYVQPQITIYRDFALWDGKQIPRTMELAQNGKRILSITIQQIEAAGQTQDSLFALAGIRPTAVPRHGEYDGPVLKAEPTRMAKPDNPRHGHGTVLVDVQLDAHGRVLWAELRQSGEKALDDAALRAAMKWEFQPMEIQGVLVPSRETIRFDF
jgi:TonB family protein